MTDKETFRALFENDYTDCKLILEKLVKPVFGEKVKERNFDLEVDTQDKDIISGIKIFADIGGVFPINFVDVTIKSKVKIRYNKVTVQRCVRNITNSFQSALIFFHYEDTSNRNWRITFVNKGENSSDSTNPKRYTYLCGKNCSCRTAAERFEILKNEIWSGQKNLRDLMVNAFSVEALTKEFYNELFAWYEWAVTLAKFPEGKAQKVSLTNKNIDTHIIRLITRLMFVWFLKQKSLIPEWIFDENELSEILSDFSAKTVVSAKKGNYYNAVIQNLFFATLNKAIEERNFAKKTKNGERNEQYGIKTLYRDDNENSFFAKSQKEIVELFKSVPFLNGGLFECLDKLDTRKSDEHNEQDYLDGFSREKDRRAFVPNCLFWNKEDDENEGLISILNRYNFTVEENTPSDVTVALDPELLGKVFENLLGVYNPETQESARKDSGSFYTPREIVDYMVNESLTAYLIENGELKIDNEKIHDFVNNPCAETASVFDKDEKALLKKKLSTVKILDPACGSGAFPMGILNRLVQLITSLEEKTDVYKLKLELIENCIYGIDIQNIAVQISKLRFFISLICEQNADNSKKNYGFDPLPNLETKFVCANSLIGLKNSEDILIDNIKPLKDELHILREKHFRAGESSDKKQLRADDEKKRNEIAAIAQKNHCQPNEQIIKNQKMVLENLEEQLELVKEPKWVDKTETQNDLFGSSSPKLFSVDENKEKRDMITKEIKKCNSIIEAEKNKKADEQFDKEIKMLLAWNPYDQNSSSPFFDADWMFGVTDGFDIVIGNPPYISTKGVTTEDKKKYEAEFGFSDDTYNLFTFKGLSLCKTGGTLNYIIPKTFWTTQTKRNMRDLILDKQINYIFDTADPFESAMVDTCVIQIQNTNFEKSHKIKFRDGSKDLQRPVDFEPIEQGIYINTQNSVIFKPTELNLKIYEKYGAKVKELYDSWWEKIKTSRDIENNKADLEKYRNSLKSGDVALLGCLTEGGQGLATANNGKYIAVRKSTKWANNIIESRPKKLAEAMTKKKIKVKGLDNPKNASEFLNKKTEKEIAALFDELKEKYGRDIFGQGYIYKLIDDSEVADVEKLTKDEKENGIDTKKKYYVPYDKGDKDGNRWYLETPFAIAWSKENVRFLKTNSGKKGEGMPVVRNPQFYFREGFCWNLINGTRSENDLKFKLSKAGVNDVGGMTLHSYCNIISDKFIVAIGNSYFASRYTESYVNFTVNFQVNDCRLIPLVIPTDKELEYCNKLVDKAVFLKKSVAEGVLSESDIKNELSQIENDLNDFVNKLYGV